MRNVVIIGSGPAAHTAAIYAGRGNLEPLMYEGMMAAGVAAGGQLTTTTEIENFPGFPEGLGGPELMDRMRLQSINCGTEIKTVTVDRVDLSCTPFKVFAGSEEIEAKTIIISTGATAKRLGVPNEEKLWNRGISACAVCDGALPIFRNQPLVVVGGGDTACEEATFLTKFSSKVTILVRRDILRASKAMQDRVTNDPKIEILWHTELIDVHGEQKLEEVEIINNQTNEKSRLQASGMFYAIGHTPNTSFLEGQIKCDETGYIVTEPGTTKTNIPGVFAAGDVQDHIYRQAVTAAGTGCMAALEAEHHITEA
ncbi:MAG: thioredoxin reductase (NADPH) [Lysobacterales bacterium]|jgi:thioredoxin reductase (NADPH)